MSFIETPLIPPPGRTKGCNRRLCAFASRFPPMGDSLRVLSWSEIRERSQLDLSLRPFVKDMLDQDGHNSCAAESTAQAIMTTRIRGGQPHVPLNPWSIYQKTSGGRDRGSNILDNVEFAQAFGCLPMAVWPRSKGPFAKPPQSLWDDFGRYFRLDEAVEIGETQETATALVDCFAVIFGWQGHSCMLDDLLDEDWAEYANSWGPGFGDQGFGTIRLRSINFGYGQVAVRTTTICPVEALEEIAAMSARRAA